MKAKYKILISLLFLVSCAKIQTHIGHDEQQKKITEIKEVQKPVVEPVAKKVVKPVKRKFSYVPNTKRVEKYCQKIDRKFYKYGWGKSRCESFNWIHVRDSVLGDPLMWVTFGDEKELAKEKKNVTMVMCGVHGDEITPVKFCFDVLHYLYQIEVNENNERNFKDNFVVVVPIVNPDSFFRKYPTRTNQRGVDVNRNFPTKDWHAKAHKIWRNRYRQDKRRNPGKKPLSEPETLFQVNLMKRYDPARIISVHAPLTILDYDGPSVATKDFNPVAHHANHLLVQMSKKAKGYRIKNYPFFPGSLGNYAGNERGVPTYTLELPSSDNRNHKKYWNKFKSSIDYALFNGVKIKESVVLNDDDDHQNSADSQAKKSN